MQIILIIGLAFYALPIRSLIDTNKNKHDIIEKCAYTRSVFLPQKNTCIVPPVIEYKNIYEKSYSMELWEFHQENCTVVNNLFRFMLYIIILVFVICLGFTA
jgi:hypothetical protein